MGPLDLVNLTPLMARTTGRSEIKIGLIDGPVAVDHPGLAGQNILEVPGKQSGACSTASSLACLYGTFVAGTLSAKPGSAASAVCPLGNNREWEDFMTSSSLQRAFYLLPCATLLLLTACITPQPRIAPPPGLYNCPAMVNITDSKAGAAIFYTTDGSSPTPSSAKYSSTFPVNSAGKVQAIAQAPGLKVSNVAAADYTCSFQVTAVAFAVQMQQRFSIPPPTSPLEFADLSPADPNYAAAQAVAPLLNRQILCHGCFLSRNFIPNQPLQRASSGVFFVSFLMAQKKIQLLSSKEADNVLASVPDANTLPGVTARRYVATALKNGLLHLHERNTLDGLSPISPTEMTTVLQTIQNNFNLPPASLQ